MKKPTPARRLPPSKKIIAEFLEGASIRELVERYFSYREWYKLESSLRIQAAIRRALKRRRGR